MVVRRKRRDAKRTRSEVSLGDEYGKTYPAGVSVWKRASDGRYIAQIEAGRYPDDHKNARKRRYVRVIRSSKPALDEAIPDAIKRANGMKNQQDVGPDEPTSESTVKQLLAYWLEEHVVKEMHRAENTVRTYRTLIENSFNPYIGHIPLWQLRGKDVRDLRKKLRSKGVSDRTTTLSTALSYANAELEIPIDPSVFTMLKRRVQRDKSVQPTEVWSPAEVEKLLAYVESTHPDLYGLVWLAVKYGVGPQELCDLRWEDIDFEAKTITVNGTKTPNRRRTLFPDDATMEILSGVGTGYRFTRGGKQIRTDWIRHWWKGDKNHRGVCKNAGAPIRKFYATRHTAASIMLANGVSLFKVSKILGHKDVGITSKVYARFIDDRHRAELQAA